MQSIARALIVLQLVLALPGWAQSTSDTFKNRCAACHGKTGAGDTTIGKNLKVLDLGSAEVQKRSDEELDAIIAKGRGKMPAYENKLNKEQIRGLVRFIRTLQK
jgi:mono/diheme cytochrome c family protein